MSADTTEKVEKVKREPKPKREQCPECGHMVEMTLVRPGVWESLPHVCVTGPARRRIPDREILDAYEATGTIRAAAARVGRTPHAVELRLHRLGVSTTRPSAEFPEFVGARVSSQVGEWLRELSKVHGTQAEALRWVLDKQFKKSQRKH